MTSLNTPVSRPNQRCPLCCQPNRTLRYVATTVYGDPKWGCRECHREIAAILREEAARLEEVL